VAEADAETRKKLFGEARLAILYSGNFGRAHSCEEFFRLARLLRGEEIHFTFSVRGNAVEALHRAVRPDDTNISFRGFASEADLPKQLAAADIHLASLKENWAGLVVPSKFFGNLAAGRPVIFAGPRKTSIARWIEEHGVGWVLDSQSLPGVAQALRELAKTRERLEETQRRCHAVYQSHFSKQVVMNRWDQELRSLLSK
jgi:glycosyltransferase involved in cell wall biosynthesis